MRLLGCRRRVLLLTAMLSVGTVCVSNATAQEAGTFTDTRDGKVYKSVAIGSLIWMAENLNYQPQAGKSWCYDNDNSKCGQYGRMYDWKTATEICPAGWRLPSRQDWDNLGKSVGGVRKTDNTDAIQWYDADKKLKSKSGWKNNGGGADGYGFSALPGGFRFSDGTFEQAGSEGFWWSSAASDDDGDAYYRSMGWNYGNLREGDDCSQKRGISVRCVRDGSGSGAGSQPQGAMPQSSFGTLADKRNGKTYKTVKIDGTVWMAENLDYKTGTNWCYDDNDSYCKKYGRLYDWETAKKACPSGWHLPTLNEWDNLVKFADSNKIAKVAGKKLKAEQGWKKNKNGTDDYGFSALPGGRRHTKDSVSVFVEIGDRGYWWTATEGDHVDALYKGINYYGDEIYTGDGSEHSGRSVRCIADGK